MGLIQGAHESLSTVQAFTIWYAISPCMELVSKSGMRRGVIKVAISVVISLLLHWTLSTTGILRENVLFVVSLAIGVTVAQIIDWRLLR